MPNPGAPVPTSLLAVLTTIHVALLVLRTHRLPPGRFRWVLAPSAVMCAAPWVFPSPIGVTLGIGAHLIWFLACEPLVPRSAASAAPRRASAPRGATPRKALAPSRPRARDPWSLLNVLALAAIASIVLALWIFVGLHGWSYYATPLRVRGYALPHSVLKPSGSVAHPLGVAGVAMLLVPVIYAVRKRWKPLAQTGSMRAWLEVHIFCGIVGPVIVTFHTAFKFNGLISVAYWSMLAVMLSGFVGRYLFVRIPRTIRGVELSHDEISARLEQLAADLSQVAADVKLPDTVRLVGDDHGARLPGPRTLRRRARHDLTTAGVSRERAAMIADALAERAQLARRLAHLNRTRRFFSAWHMFHQPLVYVMFAIAVVHVGVAVYFGYSWW